MHLRFRFTTLLSECKLDTVRRVIVRVHGAQRAERPLVDALAVTPAFDASFWQPVLEVEHQHGLLAHAKGLDAKHGKHVVCIQFKVAKLIWREISLVEDATHAEHRIVLLPTRRLREACVRRVDDLEFVLGELVTRVAVRVQLQRQLAERLLDGLLIGVERDAKRVVEAESHLFHGPMRRPRVRGRPQFKW